MTSVKRHCAAVWKKKVHIKMTDIYHEKQVCSTCFLIAIKSTQNMFKKSALFETLSFLNLLS